MHYQASYSRGDRIERHADQVKCLNLTDYWINLKPTEEEGRGKRWGMLAPIQ